MGLDYVVVTSVTRDDLPDGGSGHFAETIHRIQKSVSHARVEVLIPDFKGDSSALRKVMDARPVVLNHNLETAASLYHRVRPQASYERSLALLEEAASYGGGIVTKSGLMLGVGESDDDILKILKDLRSVNCSLLTIGQYLQPSERQLPVHRFVTPEAFERFRIEALALGFTGVASGPFVRSSYHAGDMHRSILTPDRHFDNLN